MGMSINVVAQKRNENGEWECIFFPRNTFLQPGQAEDDEYDNNEPLSWKSIALFSLMGYDAGEHNSFPSLTGEPRGLPDGVSLDSLNEEFARHDDFFGGETSLNWVFMDELLSFNYDQILDSFNGREGMFKPRYLLGDRFFHDIRILQEYNVERLIIGFDS